MSLDGLNTTRTGFSATWKVKVSLAPFTSTRSSVEPFAVNSSTVVTKW